MKESRPKRVWKYLVNNVHVVLMGAILYMISVVGALLFLRPEFLINEQVILTDIRLLAVLTVVLIVLLVLGWTLLDLAYEIELLDKQLEELE